jgi:hypothetical protein
MTWFDCDFVFPLVTQPEPPALELSAPIVGGSNLYCQPCDLSFTSNAHATQHYEGKNHAKKVKAGTINLFAIYYESVLSDSLLKETDKYKSS